MTVPTTVNAVTYAGPQAMPLAIPYKFFQDADLVVAFTETDGTITTLDLTTDYTVTGAGQPSGGTLTLVAGAMVLDESITILRDPEAIQNTSIPDGSRFFGSVLEAALDLLTMLVQNAQASVDRSVLFPLGESGYDQNLPPKADRISMIAGWDAAGNFTPLSQAAVTAAGNFTLDEFATGVGFTPGVTTTLTLSQAPGTVNNTLVTFDGVTQHKNTYSVAGLVLTFTSAIPVGVTAVDVVQSGVLPLSIPADNSVGSATLQTGAVTNAKLGAASVSSSKIASASVTLAQLAADALQGGKNAVVNGAAIVANGSDYVASVSGTYGYGKSELCKGAITGTTVAGTLTQATGSSVGRTGCAFKWSALTTTGAGICKWRFFVEAKDAIKFKNQIATVALQARQDAAASIDFAIVVSKATVADDFTATTVISTGGNIAALLNTNTDVYNRAIAMGDCSNGIMVEVTAAIGAVTNKNFEITEVQLELGSVETNYDYEAVAITRAKVARYVEFLGGSAATIGYGLAYDATHASIGIGWMEKRIAPSPTVANPTSFQVTDGALSNIAATVVSVAGNVKYGAANVTVAGGLTAGQGSKFSVNSAAAIITVDARF